MKTLLLFTLSTVCLAAFSGCKDKQGRIINEPDYSENYKYYPVMKGREWTYEATVNYGGTINVYTDIAKYNEVDECTDYYRSGVLRSTTYWGNDNNQLGCCIDMVLADYDQLNCTSDSVLIYQKVNTDITAKIYQYCERKYATNAPNYKTIKCIRTTQQNTYKAGDGLTIISYYGYGVGLILRIQKSLDNLGKVTKQETLKLVSHNF